MKTLKLNLAALEVTSFETQEHADDAATAPQRVTWDTCNNWCTRSC
jgi:hypothetical protein